MRRVKKERKGNGETKEKKTSWLVQTEKKKQSLRLKDIQTERQGRETEKSMKTEEKQELGRRVLTSHNSLLLLRSL